MGPFYFCLNYPADVYYLCKTGQGAVPQLKQFCCRTYSSSGVKRLPQDSSWNFRFWEKEPLQRHLHSGFEELD